MFFPSIERNFKEGADFLVQVRTKMGRRKGTGYRSQAILLRSLKHEPKFFQQLVDETGLHRNTVASNLNVLSKLNLIVKERRGRKVFYDLEDEGADAYADLVSDPEYWKKSIKRARREFWWDAKVEAAITLKWIRNAEEYKKEIEELQVIDPQFENYDIWKVFYLAKEWRKLKQERRKVGSDHRYRLPSDDIKRSKVAKSRIQDLLDFKRKYPEVIKEYERLVKTRLKNFQP